MKYNFNLMN